MKTVLIDNSLCSLPIADDADPELIYGYICALADAGVNYVELDFRTMMKLDRFPISMKYILRLMDPVFLKLTEHFKFDYLAVSFNDVRKGIESDVPIMLSLPIPDDFMSRSPRDVVHYASNLVKGNISLVSMYGAYPVMSRAEINQYLGFLKRELFVPVNICPTNNQMAAASNAVNFTVCGADCVTVTMGSSLKYCSMEEYFTLFTTVMGGLPKELDFRAVAQAAKLHGRIFRSGFSLEFERLVDRHEDDMLNLISAETGQKLLLRNRRIDIQTEEHDDLDFDIRDFDISLFNYYKLKRGDRFRKPLN